MKNPKLNKFLAEISKRLILSKEFNDQIIRTLILEYNFSILNKNDEIIIINYWQIVSNISKGYFIYTAASGENYIAVNDINYLAQALKNYHKDYINLVNRSDFWYFIEKNFKSLNIIKAEYQLYLSISKQNARNISYIKIITTFNYCFFYHINIFAILLSLY